MIFIGLLFGLYAPELDPWRSRAFKAGLVTALVFTATAFISYAVAPDWMWMYFIEPGAVVWSLPLIAAGYLVTFALGFASALGLRLLGRSYVVAAAMTSLVGEVMVVALTWDRYRMVGSREQWLSGDAYPLLSGSPEGPVKLIGVLGPIFVVVLVGALIMTTRARRATPSDR